MEQIGDKRIKLEQYERHEMMKISGIPIKEGGKCVQITENMCFLIGTIVENSTEIAH